MITEFHLLDDVGKVIGEGEIENGEVSGKASHEVTASLSPRTSRDVYRLFSDEFPNGYKEFETPEAMFAQCGGKAIQPKMFPTPARTRQLGLFD